MKTLRTQAAFILFLFFLGTLQAQDSIPEWMNQLPVKKGYVYGVGVGKSSDLPMATDKARMIALTHLTQNYSDKFDTFASKCDTVLGADNAIHEIVSTIKKNQQTTLKGVEIAEKVVVSEEGVTLVYLLMKLDVRSDIKTLQKQVDDDAKLNKQMKASGLMKALNEL